MSRFREAKESPLPQGAAESIAYAFAFADWPVQTLTSPVVKAYDVTTGSRVDVSGTVLTGSASISGTTVTTPQLGGLTAGKTYVLTCRVTSGGNILEMYLTINAEL